MEIVVLAILFGILMVLSFILGAYFCCRVIYSAQKDARTDVFRYEYYKLAGVRNPSDPQPYVPHVRQ